MGAHNHRMLGTFVIVKFGQNSLCLERGRFPPKEEHYSRPPFVIIVVIVTAVGDTAAANVVSISFNHCPNYFISKFLPPSLGMTCRLPPSYRKDIVEQ
jgi:hypothetical protein